MTIQGSAAPKLSVRGATKVYGTAVGRPARHRQLQPRRPRRRDRLDRRPFGLRQDHAAVVDVGPAWPHRAATSCSTASRSRAAAARSAWCSRRRTCCPGAISTPTSTFPSRSRATRPDRAWIDELLHSVGLEGFGGRFPRELSGGMQQRAALVRALSFKPSVLLMDEPFGALDSFTREEMNRLVEEIWLDTAHHHRTHHPLDRGGDLPLRPGRRA